MIGLIPCAGHATRLHGLPKYLLPLGDSYLLAIHIQRMFDAGVKHIYIGANSHNFALVSEYAPVGVKVTVYRCDTKTMSETVLNAREYIGDDDVLFTMPDTWWYEGFNPVLPSLVDRLQDDVFALATFGVSLRQAKSLGTCFIDSKRSDKRVYKIEDKPAEPKSSIAWGAMCWTREFWEYIKPADPHVGFAAQRAIDKGVLPPSVFGSVEYHDCGVPSNYYECIRKYQELEATASQAQGVNS
jgi:dTDP-glucose pyrophosphorylase